MLVTAGSSSMANLWDLRSDDYTDFKSCSLPHIRKKGMIENSAEVSSVHWNAKGDRILTSSSDKVARVWQVKESGEVEIQRVKDFQDILMNSKFNNCDQGNLVATSGLFSTVYVWDCEPESYREVARFEHADIDPDFKGLEIEWQNSKSVAVAGKSRLIHLWNVDQQSKPVVTWKGHEGEVEQIAWDPSGQLLASCSTDSYVCIWKPDSSSPKLTLKGQTGSAVSTIKWSNADAQHNDPLLAAGTTDGQILIWNIEQGNLLTKLQAHDKE